MLLGVALNAMSNLLGRVVRLPHSLRLTMVCLAVAGMLSGVIFLGGATIAQQTTVLSNTLKSQLVNVKAFLERNGIDTSLFDFGSLSSQPDASAPAAPGPAPTHSLPSAGTIAPGCPMTPEGRSPKGIVGSVTSAVLSCLASFPVPATMG